MACAVGFAAQMLLDPRAGQEGSGFTSSFWVMGGAGFTWHGPLTYAFLHGGIVHLLGNMLFLWVFGRAVEDKLGRFWFLAFYLGGGVFAGLMHAWFEPAPAVGASGAIAAVTGAFLVLFPKTRIKVLWFFILITMIQAPAWFFIGLQVAWNLLAQATGGRGNVATLAHLAGYGYGIGIAMILLWVRLLPRETYDLFTIANQAKRRRKFRELSRVDPRPAPPRKNEITEAMARARAAVSTEISAGMPERAVPAYRSLLDTFGDRPAVATLARNAQYQLGTHLYATGEHALAARAFTDFLATFGSDPEAPQIRLLLGRLLAAEGRADEARRLFERASDELKDDRLASIARAELDALSGEAAHREG